MNITSNIWNFKPVAFVLYSLQLSTLCVTQYHLKKQILQAKATTRSHRPTETQIWGHVIGNSNYLIINCVPKLAWGCSQAIRLRHINKLFYFILFYSIHVARGCVLRLWASCFLASWLATSIYYERECQEKYVCDNPER